MSKETKGRRLPAIVIGVFIFIFAIGIIAITPFVIKQVQDKQEAKHLSNLEDIFTSAIIVDQIEGGLHNDSDGAGKYEKLSEMSGFRVYNVPEDGKYSLMKDYKSGDIVVRYGEDLRYPSEEVVPEGLQTNMDLESVQAQDLFNYDESTGKVIITGFSPAGANLLTSGSVIQIPETYNGREVTEIAAGAFYNRNIMGTVVIPESIRVIGESAFSNNGIKGVSDNITKPYAGSWRVDESSWVRVGE